MIIDNAQHYYTSEAMVKTFISKLKSYQEKVRKSHRCKKILPQCVHTCSPDALNLLRVSGFSLAKGTKPRRLQPLSIYLPTYLSFEIRVALFSSQLVSGWTEVEKDHRSEVRYLSPSVYLD